MEITFLEETINIHKSWEKFFTIQNIACLNTIEANLSSGSITPQAKNVLRFTLFDLAACKYVILGQDPYPQQNDATGRAFEVGSIDNWDDKNLNASLRNILKLLHKNSFSSDDVPSIANVRLDIKSNRFNILPPCEFFQNWEEQGILLLNTALTCEVGSTENSYSHSNYWSCFIQRLINFISAEYTKIGWILWGKNAQRFCEKISSENKFECDHPQLNKKGVGSFYFENHFSKINCIDWVLKPNKQLSRTALNQRSLCSPKMSSKI